MVKKRKMIQEMINQGQIDFRQKEETHMAHHNSILKKTINKMFEVETN